MSTAYSRGGIVCSGALAFMRHQFTYCTSWVSQTSRLRYRLEQRSVESRSARAERLRSGFTSAPPERRLDQIEVIGLRDVATVVLFQGHDLGSPSAGVSSSVVVIRYSERDA